MTDLRRLRPLVAVALLVIGGCAPTPSHRPATAPPQSAPGPTATASMTPPPSPSPSPTTAPTPGSAIVPGVADRSSLDLVATYEVGLDLAVATGAADVDTTIEVRNDSGAPIDRLELNTIAARVGELSVTVATVDGQAVSVAVDDQTLVVPLGGILPDGARATVRIRYTATLRKGLSGSDWMFSRAGGTLALYRWIPWISRAVPFDRPNHGDPFVLPSSPSAMVRVTTDRPMIVATAAEDPLVDGLTTTLDLRDVRDVSIVLAPDFTLTTDTSGSTAIRAFTRPGGLDGDRLVAQAKLALGRMSERLGVAYPWNAYSVVETAGGYGLESPGLIWIPAGTTSSNLPYLVHHETAHQWFYGLVGNDQQAEPFADEAAADLLARTVLGALRGSRCDQTPLDRAITRYSTACYYEVVYIQGGNVLDDIRAAMGTERFWTAIHDYLEAHRLGLGGTKALLEALREASPADLLTILRVRFPSLY